MPDPIVFISHNTIKPGKLDDLRAASDSVFAALEADKPGTILHYGYLDAKGGWVYFVHVFPDADAMDAHFEGANDRVAAASALMETRAFEIYGNPSEAVVEALGRIPSAELTIHPGTVGGYIRLGG